MTAQKIPRPTAVMNRISRLMNACQTSSPARINPLRRARPGSRSRSVRQMISGTRNCETMFGWPPACDTMLGANVQNNAPIQAASREATNWRESTKYHEMPVSANARVRNTLNATCGPNSRVTGAIRQRNSQHRRVGHHVHPIGVIHAIGEERISAIAEHSRTMRQHPLEESLILWIGRQLLIKVEPQRGREVERYSDERRYRKSVPPSEPAPRPAPPRRLRARCSGAASTAGTTEIGAVVVTPSSRVRSSASRSSASVT